MLLLTTIFWGISFPTMKALSLVQSHVLPDASSWFVTSVVGFTRFGLAALIMAAWSWRTLPHLTRSELWQGVGLGFFGGGGMILQMDGLSYTQASTSAFITQCYCLWIPILAAMRTRRCPSPVILVCTVLVFVGISVLAQVDWRTLRLGRGEIETLLSSFFFTGQILWLERPGYARNHVGHFTTVMFASMALFSLPVALATTGRASDWATFLTTPAVPGLIGILILFCTMVAFVVMNHWQRFVSATEAGLIYCVEPVFASVFALFLPAWYSRWTGVEYWNETLTLNLVLGGGAITAAILVIQVWGGSGSAPAKDSAVVAASS